MTKQHFEFDCWKKRENLLRTTVGNQPDNVENYINFLEIRHQTSEQIM
jgi:hypothetical protein